MNKIILHILLIGLLPISSFSQDKMSKQEIISYLNNIEKNYARPQTYTHHLDTSVIDLIEQLRTSNIDTIGVYEIDFEGYESIDSCDCKLLPWVAYVQWIKDDKIYQQKLTSCCVFEPILIDNSMIIRYYINAKSSIEKDKIQPVIKGFTKDKDGKTIPIMGMTVHTIRYKIYCDINGSSKFIRFGAYEIEEKDNVFYLDNQNSIINSWRNMIENQINGLDE